MRVTTTLTPLWEVHIAFSRLQIGFASTRKVQWPIFNCSLSYLVFQSIVLLAKTWRGHLEIGSRNNNSRCLASPHLQNSSYLFFSRVEVCILDCFPCTHILTLNPRIRKKVKKSLESIFFSRNGFHPTKNEILLCNVPFTWTCENLKSLVFHILTEHLNNLWRDFQFEIFSLLMYLFISCLPNTNFCHYQFIRGVVNDSVLSFLCVTELCLCSSSRFVFFLIIHLAMKTINC